MSHVSKAKKDLLTRVRRIIGQAQGLERALENETECLEFLQQVAALKGSVSGLMTTVLEDHIREHLPLSANGSKNDEIENLLRVIKTFMK